MFVSVEQMLSAIHNRCELLFGLSAEKLNQRAFASTGRRLRHSSSKRAVSTQRRRSRSQRVAVCSHGREYTRWADRAPRVLTRIPTTDTISAQSQACSFSPAAAAARASVVVSAPRNVCIIRILQLAKPSSRRKFAPVLGYIWVHSFLGAGACDGRGKADDHQSTERSLLRFSDPRGETTAVDVGMSAPGRNDMMPPPKPPFVSELTVAPQRGRLVLFPSWLGHRVDPAVLPLDDERGDEQADDGDDEADGDEEHDDNEDEDEDEDTAGGDGESTREKACEETTSEAEAEEEQQLLQSRYRVAISFNLHGEWAETAQAHAATVPTMPSGGASGGAGGGAGGGGEGVMSGTAHVPSAAAAAAAAAGST